MPASDPRYSDAIQALKSLEKAGYATKLAGGCVRDRLLGRRPADYDLATTATPEQVMLHFRTEKLSTIPTGIEHGTVTVVMSAGPLEITTLRRDVKTDGRRAQVAFSADFAADAQRRDFTINALFEDANGYIDDYVGGQEDLGRGVLRFVGPPRERIKEDYLRILRLFRFWACLGFAPDEASLAAAASEKAGLRLISQERLTQEWGKLTSGPAAATVLHAMAATAILAELFPELAGAPLPEPSVLTAWQQGQPASLAILGGLAWSINMRTQDLASFAGRLRLPLKDIRRLSFFPIAGERLLAPWQDTAACLSFLDDCTAAAGEGSWQALYAPVFATDAKLAARSTQLESVCLAFGHRRLVDLPLNGKDVLNLVLEPGPAVGIWLRELRHAYYNGVWTSREEGLAYLQRQLLKAEI